MSLKMKQRTLAHELFCDITISLTDTYLSYSIVLAQPIFMRASARELLVPFLHLWYGGAAGFEPVTSSSETDALLTKLSRLSLENKFLYSIYKKPKKWTHFVSAL